MGLCLPPEGDGWTGSLITYARDAAEQAGIQAVVETVSAAAPLLMESIEEMIQSNVNAVVLYGEDEAALQTAAERLKEARIPLILIGNGLPSGEYTALVRGDDYAIGQAAARAIADRLEGQGAVLQLGGAACAAMEMRRQGFEDELKNHPGLELVASDGTGGRWETARALMEVWLDSREIDAVYCHSDEIALGAIEIAQERMREDVQIVTGVGGEKQALDMLVKNHRYLKETYLYAPSMAGEAVAIAVQAASGEEVPTETILPFIQITAVNALEYYDEDSRY